VYRLRHYVILALALWAAMSPATRAGAASRPVGQAVQFRIGNSFTLSDFGGTTFAYQRYLGPDVAWRISLGVDLRSEEGEESIERSGDPEIDKTFDVSEWGHTVTLASEWLVYRGDEVSVYFGGGPRITYTSSRSEYWDYYSGSTHYRRGTTEGYGAGLQACFGVQWAATDWLALHAEYNVQFTYSHNVAEDVETITEEEGDEVFYIDTTTTDRTFLDSRGVRFGLSAYF
jgi:hypothetical protein